MKLLFENWRKYLVEGLPTSGSDFDYFIDVLYHFTVQPIMQGPLAPDNEADILGSKEEFKNQFKMLPDDIKMKLFHQFMNTVEDMVEVINAGGNNETPI